MTSEIKKFIFGLSKLTLVLSLIYFLFFTFVDKKLFLPVFVFIIMFLYGFTILIHYYLLKSTTVRLARFSVFFMLSTTLKLVIYLVFLVIYLILYKENAINFVIFFLLNYFIFTFYEIKSILKFIKSSEPK